jgi:hypothetical protein
MWPVITAATAPMLVSAVASDTTERVLSELKLNLVFSGAATGSGWLFFVAILSSD